MYKYQIRLFLICAVAIVVGGFLSRNSTTTVFADEESGAISVTAQISGQVALSLDICDSHANFGSGLNYLGAEPQPTTETILVHFDSTSGDAVYSWQHYCAGAMLDSGLLNVESPLPFSVSFCANESTGGSSLKVADGNLRWIDGRSELLDATFIPFDAQPAFPLCTENSMYMVENHPAGHLSVDMAYLLRIPAATSDGSFDATTYWEVTN